MSHNYKNPSNPKQHDFYVQGKTGVTSLNYQLVGQNTFLEKKLLNN